MPIDVSGAQAAITDIFQNRTLRTIQRDPVVTERCGFGPRSGNLAIYEGVVQERGDYQITLPALTTLELQPGENVMIDEIPDRVFVIVWTPPRSNLNLSRRYGANEVR